MELEQEQTLMAGNFPLWMHLHGEEHAAEANKVDDKGVFYASTPEDFEKLLEVLKEDGVTFDDQQR